MPVKDQAPNQMQKSHQMRFSQSMNVRKIFSPQKLHRVLLLLTCLPHDAVFSVTALYEALYFLTKRIVPDVSWKVEALVTGFLQPNCYARAFHTHAIWVILNNYRRVIHHRRYPVKFAPIIEQDFLSVIPERLTSTTIHDDL